jgi:hypothetical protein
MRKLMNRKIVEQGGICPICYEEFTDYNDIVPDHRCRAFLVSFAAQVRSFGVRPI